jgi:adenosylcobinamide-phosphate synthase
VYASTYHSLNPSPARLNAEKINSAASHQVAQEAWWLMDYVPARMTAIALAVVGNFEEVVEAWRQRSYEPQTADVNSAAARLDTTQRLDPTANTNDRLIQMALHASLNARGQLRVDHLRLVVGLVWRVVVLWLLLIALLTLARLLG